MRYMGIKALLYYHPIPFYQLYRTSAFRMAGRAPDPNRPASPTKRARHLIQLTPRETDVFNTICDVVQHYRLTTVVRVAGGWVRDKILGFDSKDIDITVDNMAGVKFAEMVNMYLQDVRGEHVGRIGVIQANPEQSKHLETATFTIHNAEIDVNSLRTESYALDSRIPTIAVGTAFEDAMRRDFTINAIFYNLNTKEIEDFTRKGVADIAAKILRTPIDALQTFKDDPLRALRAVRFVGRLKFSLCPELQRALKDENVHRNLSTKVSRERVGIEVSKMFFDSGSTPSTCVQHLLDHGLYSPSCLLLPDHIDTVGSGRLSIRLVQNAERYLSRSSAAVDVATRRLIMFSCFLFPFHGISVPGPKNKPQHLVRHIIMDALKLSLDLYKKVMHLLDNAVRLRDSTSRLWSPDPTDDELLCLGHTMRSMESNWMDVFHISACLFPDEVVYQESLLEWLQSSELQNVHRWKPLLTGKDMMRLFQVTGPNVGMLMEKQFDWRVLNPFGETEQLIEHLRSCR